MEGIYRKMVTNGNLYTLFRSQFPDDTSSCFIETHEGQYYSWEDFEYASAKIAHLITHLDLPPHSRIAVQVEKSPEALMLYLAVLRAGHIYLPLNTAYREDEIRYFIQDAQPALVVCDPSNFGWVSSIVFSLGGKHVLTLGENRNGSLIERAAHYPNTFDTVHCAPYDLAAILYTSGTTGRSKGAMLTHGNLAANIKTLHEYWQWNSRDVLLHALPLFHIHGLFVAAHGALFSGSKIIFLPKFDSCTVIQHLPRSSVFMGVPTYYVRLLSESNFNQSVCSSMRLFISGSAPLLPHTFEAFSERTGHTILERYGMSETAMLTSNPYLGERISGSVGMPLPSVSIRITGTDNRLCGASETGNIEVKGPNVFSGYWNKPDQTKDAFTQDGYFKTGDLGQWKDNGYLTIVGRSTDLIISGGYNVYPKEIEILIDKMTGVLESAVVGMKHPEFGEAVVAIVVPQPNMVLSESSMIALIKASIANFKVPKRIYFASELPRNTMGKIQKNVLRQQYQEEFIQTL